MPQRDKSAHPDYSTEIISTIYGPAQACDEKGDEITG
jgi:hypothetical protein